MNIITTTLSNKQGMTVEIINLGARIKSLKFPVNGKPTEMTVGYATANEYTTDPFYLGATCGRVCNRIAKGAFELNGKHYQLSQNDDQNCLHGGEDNFSHRLWQIEQSTLRDDYVAMCLTSADGDQGFPGKVTIKTSYQLTENNELIIDYTAETDAATPINITNHAYFNLGEENCEALQLQLMSSAYLERNNTNSPTGNIVSVAQSDFNFRQPAIVGERQRNTQDEKLKAMRGYDHCFVLDNSPFSSAKAILTSAKNKVKLSLYTDQAAVQLYTGSYLSGNFNAYQGLCLEAQNYSDAVNIAHFPNSILLPEQRYQQRIVYQFTTV
jgi:aldose 1-epimerase